MTMATVNHRYSYHSCAARERAREEMGDGRAESRESVSSLCSHNAVTEEDANQRAESREQREQGVEGDYCAVALVAEVGLQVVHTLNLGL
jgi:hypothetical protein